LGGKRLDADQPASNHQRFPRFIQIDLDQNAVSPLWENVVAID
jgi:hypothetical protein